MTDYEAAFWKLKNNWHESVKHYEDRIEKLAEALRWIVEQERQTAHPTVCAIVKTARKALEGKE